MGPCSWLSVLRNYRQPACTSPHSCPAPPWPALHGAMPRKPGAPLLAGCLPPCPSLHSAAISPSQQWSGCLPHSSATATTHAITFLSAWGKLEQSHTPAQGSPGAQKVRSPPCRVPRPPGCRPLARCAAPLPPGRLPTRLPSCGGAHPGAAGLLPGAGPCASAAGPCSSG